jgi:hypothetical protein
MDGDLAQIPGWCSIVGLYCFGSLWLGWGEVGGFLAVSVKEGLRGWCACQSRPGSGREPSLSPEPIGGQ